MNFDNNFCLQRKCKANGKILYFRDMESMEDYVKNNGGEDAFEDFFFDVKPFSEPLIDNYEHRSELERMLGFSGINANDLSIEEIEGVDSDDYKAEDTTKRLKEIYKNEKSVQKLNKDSTITITDESAEEITARKATLDMFKVFKYDYDNATDEQKGIYEKVLKEYNMDINNLDAYIEEAINTDFSIYTKEFKSKEEKKRAEEEWEKLDSVKQYNKYKEAIMKASDAVYKNIHDKYIEEHKEEIEAEREKYKNDEKKAIRIDDTFFTDSQFLLGTRFIFMIKFDVVEKNIFAHIDDYYLNRLAIWIQSKVAIPDFIQVLNNESNKPCSKATVDVSTSGRTLIFVVNAYQDIPKHKYEICKDNFITLIQDIISEIDGNSIPNDIYNRKVFYDEDIYFSYDADREMTLQEGIEKLKDKLDKIITQNSEPTMSGFDPTHGFSDFDTFGNEE